VTFRHRSDDVSMKEEDDDKSVVQEPSTPLALPPSSSAGSTPFPSASMQTGYRESSPSITDSVGQKRQVSSSTGPVITPSMYASASASRSRRPKHGD